MQRQGSPPLNTHGELAVGNTNKVNELNRNFLSVFTTDDGTLPELNKRTNVRLSNIKLYLELVHKFMFKLPHKFSRSPDGIPSAVLKCLSYELCTPMYIIFKMSLDSSVFRPVSILPAMCRLFE